MWSLIRDSEYCKAACKYRYRDSGEASTTSSRRCKVGGTVTVGVRLSCRGGFVSRQNLRKPIAEHCPCEAFFIRIFVVHIVSPDLASGQYVILAAINDIQRNAECLHHRRTCPAQVMRRPGAVLSLAQNKEIVVGSVHHRLARPALTALFESYLAIADLLADRLHIDMILAQA
ncbi:MAG: hypothetical protein JWQ03_3144 [Variovorax sp.]|nr:hypothetical protein [Variovorax sp.]